MSPTRWQRVESLAAAIAVLAATIHFGFAWWWLFALFLAFDASMVGYMGGTRLGAATYNAIHNYAGPAALVTVALVWDLRWAGLLALAWAFHVSVDRALGYGLKHADAFEHTHLGTIGRAKE